MLTPKDIELKEFARAVRGYKESEVDEFLNYLMVDLKTLLEENNNLREENNNLKQQIKGYDSAENSLVVAMEQAKNLMQDMVTNAKRQADTLVNNAQLEAESKIASANSQVRDIKNQARELVDKLDYFRNQYRLLLEQELSSLEAKADRLEEEITQGLDLFLGESSPQQNYMKQDNYQQQDDVKLANRQELNSYSQLEKRIMEDINPPEGRATTIIRNK